MRHAADVCTALRVLLAPVLAWQLALPRGRAGWVPLVVYLLAAATDYIDGVVARATGSASRQGRVFDHGADALLLFPAFIVLAMQQRLPFVLPLAAVTAFTLYVVDGWRRGGSLGTIELTGSRSGAVGGVLNYGIAGAAAAAVALDSSALDRVVYAAAFAIAAVNAMAALERLVQLLTSARGSLVAEREAPASRSSP
jgi:phosphatidylglycerophosphate synthase